MAKTYGTTPTELLKSDWLDYQFNEYVWLVGYRAEKMLDATYYDKGLKKTRHKYELHEALNMPKMQEEMMDADAVWAQLKGLFGSGAKTD